MYFDIIIQCFVNLHIAEINDLNWHTLVSLLNWNFLMKIFIVYGCFYFYPPAFVYHCIWQCLWRLRYRLCEIPQASHNMVYTIMRHLLINSTCMYTKIQYSREQFVNGNYEAWLPPPPPPPHPHKRMWRSLVQNTFVPTCVYQYTIWQRCLTIKQ